jgi:hypothetical protein
MASIMAVLRRASKLNPDRYGQDAGCSNQLYRPSSTLPNTNNTPDYKDDRKKHVYAEALAEAQWQDGVLSRERALLNRLRDSLSISESEAEEIGAGLVPG